MTSDPSVAGFKRIPNVIKYTRHLEKHFAKEIDAIEYETIEVKPIEPIDENEAKLALHTQD